MGILPRDLDIVKYVCQKKKETDYPKSFQYSTSKNTPERTVDIAKELYNVKLLKKHVVSLQHTMQSVLDCVDRYNIPVKRQIPMIRDLNKAKMPCISQMIMGMPGDNYEYWIKALTDTVEWGIHFECRIYDFQLLPNAPAAQPDYMNKWEIETRTRYHFINGYHKFSEQENAIAPTSSEFIVKTSTYSIDDWLEMKMFGKIFMAMHGGSITKWTSMFCRNTLGISYYDFYKDLYETFFKNKKYVYANSIYKNGYKHFRDFLQNDDATDEIQIPMLDNGRYYQMEELILWNALYDNQYNLNETFWKEFESYILERYKDPILKELIDFNKNMLFTLDYDYKSGKEILCTHNWFDYIDFCTWNCSDNTNDDFDIKSTLIDSPEKFSTPKIWKTFDTKLGAFPMGPNQDSKWKDKHGSEKIEMFVNCILVPTYMRGTRTVFNRGKYIKEK